MLSAHSLLWIAKSPLHAVHGPTWYCPLCARKGRFLPVNGRDHARCWRCGSLERHRLLWHALGRVPSTPSWEVLHIAPERCLRRHFSAHFPLYTTGDLERRDVDLPDLDICRMALPSQRFDMVIASHVLEHVEDDRRAIREVHRVLKPGGVAILPVPCADAPTVEFGEARADEMGHWRRPGLDYLERYRECFELDMVTADEVPAEWQAHMHRRQGVDGWLPYDLIPLCWRRA
jgi:predicted SAM-dependent methyltransferase